MKKTTLLIPLLILLLALSGCGEGSSSSKLDFETVDINGNAVSLDDFSSAKVIMINFWEPWCGPCVGEMADLEKLYENYKDKGFVIIGAFTTEGQDSDVKAVMQKCNTSYPIVRASKSMYDYMSDYVPTTIFIDGSGKVLSEEPFIGAADYANWETFVTGYLGGN